MEREYGRTIETENVKGDRLMHCADACVLHAHKEAQA